MKQIFVDTKVRYPRVHKFTGCAANVQNVFVFCHHVALASRRRAPSSYIYSDWSRFESSILIGGH